MIKNFFTLGSILATYLATAQVKSKPFDVMLKGLLSHTVNEVQVTEIDISDTSIIFLDAREKNEYEISHIKNARWLDMIILKKRE